MRPERPKQFLSLIAILLRATAPACLFLTILTAFGQSPDLVAKSERANQAMRSRRFGEAISLYRELVRAFPDNPGLAKNLGLALHSAAEYPEAVRQFQFVVKRQPQLAAAWFLLGVDLQNLNRPTEALEPLQRALQIEPGNEGARLELADALLKSERLSEAAAQFHSVVSADPTNTKALLGLGLSYASLDGQAFEKLEKSFPNSAYLHMLVGQARADQNQYRSAFHHYRQALKLDPGLGDAHRAIASIYRATGHPDWVELEEEKGRRLPKIECPGNIFPCLFAEKRYEELVASVKNNRTAESFYWQARAYNELALRAHARLTELPPSAEIHQLLAVICEMRELYPDAVQEWRRALAFQPGNKNFKKRLSQSLWASGESKAALELAGDLLKAEPDSADLHLLVGEALLKMQLPEQAVPHLKQVVSLEPKNLPAHSSLASAYLRLGLYQDAIPHLEAALPLDRDGTLRYQLATAYRSAGQAGKAASILAEYRLVRKSVEEKNASLKLENEITAP